MKPTTSASDFLPARRTLPALRRAAAVCEGCELYQRATQTVFGEGAGDARIMFVGEMPGDREDQAGKPFVGPAGRLLDEAIEAAGIARDTVYVTNAVKHFQWEERGKRRLHKKPRMRHVQACRPWLDAEMAVVKPELIVCLGATAAQALLGPSFRITLERGRIIEREGLPKIMATYHPSAILRAPKREDAHRMLEELKNDLRAAVRQIMKRSLKTTKA
jgi:uracil-DNA glycosylase family protein